MFILTSKDGPVLMKDGTPFTYSTDFTASLGKRVLETATKAALKIVRVA